MQCKTLKQDNPGFHLHGVYNDPGLNILSLKSSKDAFMFVNGSLISVEMCGHAFHMGLEMYCINIDSSSRIEIRNLVLWSAYDGLCPVHIK